MLIDTSPHPNPAKAADGKRLHALGIDTGAATVVQRIFAEFIAGHGLYAIAEHLTRDGISCPSAHDPDRNRHRCGIAWSKSAIRAILTNPRSGPLRSRLMVLLSRRDWSRHAGIMVIREQARRGSDHEVVETP